ncbi:MAG: FecR domain-containing protein [Tannerellaceae bacterium]|nr:FecR domain-containing protein [Tannerellaceae bacterium]
MYSDLYGRQEKNIREVALQGEAYFEVSPDSVKPFIIKTDRLDVRVTGTSFNIQAYEEEETVDVVLVSGKVNVFLPDREAEQELEMMPDTWLSYHKATAGVSVERVTGIDCCA